MKTQKAVRIFGSYSYEVALAESGVYYSRSFRNGKTQPWERMPSDIAEPARNMPLQPAPYRCRLPVEKA